MGCALIRVISFLHAEVMGNKMPLVGFYDQSRAFSIWVAGALLSQQLQANLAQG